MNDSPYGLTASVWTHDEAAFARFADELECGTVFLNRCVRRPWRVRARGLTAVCRCDYLDPALAWTGLKDSGRGVSLSKFGASWCSLGAMP